MRLAPGVTVETATAGLRADQAAIRDRTLWTIRRPPDRDAYLRRPFVVRPAADGGAGLASYYGDAVRALFALAALVLLACCGNVATVLLAHGAGRQHELSVRAALGASRWSAARQLMVDSLVLSLPGAAIGLAMALWAGPWILAQWDEIYLDRDLQGVASRRVWAVATAAGVGTGLACSLAAAWRAARVLAVDRLRTQGTSVGSAEWTRTTLVAVQLAFSVVVLVTGSLLLLSHARVVLAPAMGQLDDVIAVQLRLGRSNVAEAAREDAVERARHSIAAALPGALTSVAVTAPVHAGVYLWALAQPGMESLSMTDRMFVADSVSPSHFEVLRTPLVSGRGFDDRDTKGAPLVAVVNHTFARRFLGGESRVPQRVGVDAGRDMPTIEIVGVVDDIPYENVVDAPDPVLYLPRGQLVVARSSHSLGACGRCARAVVRAGAPRRVGTPAVCAGAHARAHRRLLRLDCRADGGTGRVRRDELHRHRAPA